MRNAPYGVEDCEKLRCKAWRLFAYRHYKEIINNTNSARASGPNGGEELRHLTLEPSRVPTEKQIEIFKQRVQSLAAMYGTVERFMKDIQAISFDVAQGRQASLQQLDFSNPPDDPKQWPALCPSEQMRLQRGLLRYELLCRLLGSCPEVRNVTEINFNPYTDHGPFEVVEDFMSPWESQEILAVRAYVRYKYELLHLNTQSEFLVDVRRLDQRSCNSPSEVINDAADKQLPVSKGELPQFHILASWTDLRRVMGYPRHWADSMSCLGLVALQNILRSDAESRAKLHGVSVIWIKSLPLRKWLSPEHPASYFGRVQRERRRRGQTTWPLRGANPVFLAALKQTDELDSIGGKSLYRGMIRVLELGWVFWEDRTRLSTLHLLLDNIMKHPEQRLARHFTDETLRPIEYDVKSLLYRAKGALITEEDWNNFIIPKYGFRTPDGLMDFSCVKNILSNPSSW